MIKKAVQFIYKYLLFPTKVNMCSQTLYQSLLGTIRLYQHNNDKKWEKRANQLVKLLVQIQRPDGGFDIGYDFNFGKFHKKGESTSPELVAMLALVEYYKIFGGEEVKISAQKAAKWIKSNALNLGDGNWSIPYGPYSTKEVMVYNGTSFAVGAIGVYLSIFKDDKLEEIYHGMNNYLFSVLSSSSLDKGKFWFYSDQMRNDLTILQRNKIDYYHQMQQVEMHSIAEISLTSPFQKQIILDATEHIFSKQDESGIIPYFNTYTPIHLWGFCSCASGFIYASIFDNKRKSDYIEGAKRIVTWILENAWTGEYFYPIVDENGKVVDSNYYVRSDAWVFNTVALAIKENVISGEYINICEKCYTKMELSDFSGLENHASNFRIRIVYKLIEFTNKIYKLLWRK
ncbi:beta-L-arabinofuranosidase domain-containing protein [Sediminibacterium sp.]|uniref:beta-L-arabinofuranosidase domain-containing protein n=1 Tax=Sediminibacterium sp. TaxID=1917865 RepID=UPI003F6E4744